MRGNAYVPTKPTSKLSFNPRPALSCGATAGDPLASLLDLVSIRAPHFHAGQRELVEGLDACDRVSIRAPHFHAGQQRDCI